MSISRIYFAAHSNRTLRVTISIYHWADASTYRVTPCLSTLVRLETLISMRKLTQHQSDLCHDANRQTTAFGSQNDGLYFTNNDDDFPFLVCARESKLWYFDFVCIFAISASTYSIHHGVDITYSGNCHAHGYIIWWYHSDVPYIVPQTASHFSAPIVSFRQTSCRSFITYYGTYWADTTATNEASPCISCQDSPLKASRA